MNIIYAENFVKERIDAAKEKAAKVRNAQKIETIEEAEMVLRYVISKHYNIPFFDKYFDDRSLDDLVFEVELIMPDRSSAPETISEKIKENKEEISQLADEFEKMIDDTESVDDGFDDMAKQFMETGNFIEKKDEELFDNEPIMEDFLDE